MLVSSVMEKIQSNSAPDDANESEQHHLQTDDQRIRPKNGAAKKRNRASSNNEVKNNV